MVGESNWESMRKGSTATVFIEKQRTYGALSQEQNVRNECQCPLQSIGAILFDSVGRLAPCVRERRDGQLVVTVTSNR